MIYYSKYLKILALLFITLISPKLFSQEKEIKKIIIDKPSQNQRLLSPPVDKKKDIIKLIPPKEISNRKDEKIKEIQEAQEKKRKAIEEKQKKEIEEAQRKQEEKKRIIQEDINKKLEANRKEEERKKKN